MGFASPPHDGVAFVVVMCTIAHPAGSGLFTEVRGTGVLGSPFAESWIKSCNTPPR
jgi:hypothetical protein